MKVTTSFDSFSPSAKRGIAISESPISITEYRDYSSIFGYRIDIESVGANHKINMDYGFIDALLLALLLAFLFITSYTVIEACAESKVACCVLIKQSIEEKDT